MRCVPPFPTDSVKVNVISLPVLARMVLGGDEEAEKAFPFLKDVVEKDDSTEFNGYNTRATRSEG